ncbi:hypothetical protein LT330_006807 [Penicillium expansum]|nr:hypothetical protein LT330_006807 [Penicillium expansum]
MEPLTTSEYYVITTCHVCHVDTHTHVAHHVHSDATPYGLHHSGFSSCISVAHCEYLLSSLSLQSTLNICHLSNMLSPPWSFIKLVPSTFIIVIIHCHIISMITPAVHGAELTVSDM